MNRRRQSGFTLLELLVGLTLLGLIVGVIFAALNTGLAGAGATAHRSERLNQIRAAQETLRRMIKTARPVSWADAARDRIAFDGETGAVSFISVLPPWPGRGGPHQLRLERDGDRLILRRKIDSGESRAFDFSGRVEQTVLLSNVRAVRFAYFGPTRPREPAKWHDGWRNRASLPTLIRLRVAFAGETGTKWPELLVAPVLGRQPR